MNKNKTPEQFQKNAGIKYEFKTSHGKMWVNPGDIISALVEQSNNECTDITPPDEDLQGWSIMNGTDENGVSRPLFLMRILPGPSVPIAYNYVAGDDYNMRNIILREIYKLTPFKIWIKQLKRRMMNFFKFGRRYKKPPKNTSGWLRNLTTPEDALQGIPEEKNK